MSVESWLKVKVGLFRVALGPRALHVLHFLSGLVVSRFWCI